MKLSELMKILPTLTDSERLKIKPFLITLSTMSQRELRKHVETFSDKNRDVPIDLSYPKYIEEQNDLIKQLVEIEISDVGRLIRETQLLPPLSLDTEVPY